MVHYITVDDQLRDFEDDIQYTLYQSILKNINHDYWEELDELDDGSHSNLRTSIEGIFKNIKGFYYYTPVQPLLKELHNIIEYTVWSMLNVPYPRLPNMHMLRVTENIYEIYLHHYYSILRTEMIMVNHNASVIQRCWRKMHKLHFSKL